MNLWFNHRNFRTFSEELVDKEQEKLFKEDHLSGDIRQSSVIIFVSIFIACVILTRDCMEFMNLEPEFRPPMLRIVLKIVLLSLMFLCVVILNLKRTINTFSLSVSLYMFGIAFIVIADQYSRPPDFIGSFYILMLLGNYLVFPLPLKFQIPPSFILSSMLIWIFLTYKEPVYDSEKVYAIFTILMINVVGIIVSFTKGRYRRSSFLHLQEETKVKKDLQDTLHKIKHLSGILPICANCLKIRDEDNQWQRPDSYIREHSEAEFSHSICPECAKEVYPDYI